MTSSSGPVSQRSVAASVKTPATPYGIPRAGADGKIASDWLPILGAYDFEGGAAATQYTVGYQDLEGGSA